MRYERSPRYRLARDRSGLSRFLCRGRRFVRPGFPLPEPDAHGEPAQTRETVRANRNGSLPDASPAVRRTHPGGTSPPCSIRSAAWTAHGRRKIAMPPWTARFSHCLADARTPRSFGRPARPRPARAHRRFRIYAGSSRPSFFIKILQIKILQHARNHQADMVVIVVMTSLYP